MAEQMNEAPLIVGIGGTLRQDSSSERALKVSLAEAERLGATTLIFANDRLDLPPYAPEGKSDRPPEVEALVDALRRARGVIISSPCYHGSVSGLLKNALDYAADIDDKDAPFLAGRAVGLIACAFGPQATATTLIALRSIAHAMRGWPTAAAVPVNTLETKFLADGSVSDDAVQEQLHLMASQVVEFASRPGGVAVPVVV